MMFSLSWQHCNQIGGNANMLISPVEVSDLHVQIVGILIQVCDDEYMASIFINEQVTQG